MRRSSLAAAALWVAACGSDAGEHASTSTTVREPLTESRFTTASEWPGDRTYEVYVRPGASGETVTALGARFARAGFVSGYARITDIALRREFYDYFRADLEIDDGDRLLLRADAEEFPSGFRILLRPGVDRGAIGDGLASLDDVAFVRRGDEFADPFDFPFESEYSDTELRVMAVCGEFGDRIDWVFTIQVVFFDDADLDDVEDALRIVHADHRPEQIVYYVTPEHETAARLRFAADDDLRFDPFITAGSQEWLEFEVPSHGQSAPDTEALWALDGVEWLNEPFVSCSFGLPNGDGGGEIAA